ncbi:hypothetical protein Hypma_008279 [Hypsizygus marmoreus]|uniref:F-box domain-containing protein n=1 Tax=Hypsizygus marmoreus TaxID=39966 RepID=A0A369JW19_HYPMA|nr:hypothetical protein Hypma_008279 [Hypsizygus marmoreus]
MRCEQVKGIPPQTDPPNCARLALFSFDPNSLKLAGSHILPGLRIPLELIDKVFEYCTSDQHLLATFSLVCKAYLERTRTHSFSELHITSNLDAQAFIRLFESPLYTFNEPGIVAELELLDEAQDSKLVSICVGDLGYVSPRTLLFEEGPASDQLLVMQPVFRHLTDLQLIGVYATRGEDVMEYITLFPHLYNLVLERGSCESIADPDPIERSGEWVDIRLRWCLSCHKIPIIPDLTLDGEQLTSSGEDEVSTYLAQLGPALESLQLRFEETPDDFHPTNFLSNHSGLKQLQLFGQAGPLFEVLIFRWLNLSHSNSASLGSFPIEIDTVAWAELDALFARSTFTNAPLTIALRVGAKSFLPDTFESREAFEEQIRRRITLSFKKNADSVPRHMCKNMDS